MTRSNRHHMTGCPAQTHGGAELVGAWLRLDYRSNSRAGYKTNYQLFGFSCLTDAQRYKLVGGGGKARQPGTCWEARVSTQTRAILSA